MNFLIDAFDLTNQAARAFDEAEYFTEDEARDIEARMKPHVPAGGGMRV